MYFFVFTYPSWWWFIAETCTRVQLDLWHVILLCVYVGVYKILYKIPSLSPVTLTFSFNVTLIPSQCHILLFIFFYLHHDAIKNFTSDILSCVQMFQNMDMKLEQTYNTNYKDNLSVAIIFFYCISRSVRDISYLLTYTMEQSPSWEANWFSASQDIPRILWNLKVHYCIHLSLS
jgi:hypothetical protein